jgi:2-methylcitrate dehydratase PrpD
MKWQIYLNRRSLMNNTAESSPIEKLVANVLETRFENFNQKDLEHAKNRVIDTIGCLIGGAKDPGNPELVKLVRDWGGKEEATILVHGGRVPAQNAAMINSIMARSFDFGTVSAAYEDRWAATHLSETTVMTAITMGEVKNVNGREFLCALMVGDDVATRVLLAGAGSGLTTGWDRIGPINPFAAAAIAGRILGLNKKQMRNAFGIALNTLAGSFDIIQDTTTSFKIGNGLSARSGIFSAELAKAGWTGPRDALQGKNGFYHLYNEGCAHPEVLTDNLGKRYYSDGTFKPYSSCRGTHAAIDCALALIKKYPIEARDIQEVAISIPAGYAGNILALPFQIGDFPHADAIFSNQYTVAIALMKKGVRPEHFTEETIRDPQINDFIKKVKLSADMSGQMGARVKVTLKDGREFTEEMAVAKGDQLRNPVSREEIIAKFWVNVDYSRTIARKNAEKLLALLENIEELDSVNRIVQLLVA